MRTDPHAHIPRDDTADTLRRELLSDPHYIRLVHPDNGRVLPIHRAQSECIRLMLLAGWTKEGGKP